MEIDVADGSVPTEEGEMPVKIITASSTEEGLMTRMVLPATKAREVAAFLLSPPPAPAPPEEALELEEQPVEEVLLDDAPEPAPFRGGGGAEVE